MTSADDQRRWQAQMTSADGKAEGSRRRTRGALACRAERQANRQAERQANRQAERQPTGTTTVFMILSASVCRLESQSGNSQPI